MAKFRTGSISISGVGVIFKDDAGEDARSHVVDGTFEDCYTIETGSKGIMSLMRLDSLSMTFADKSPIAKTTKQLVEGWLNG